MKTKLYKTVRNFIFLNLFALLPVLVFVAFNAVRELSVDFLSTSFATSILVGDGNQAPEAVKYDLFFKANSNDGKITSITQYCPTDAKLSSPCFRVETPGELDVRVQAIRMNKYFVLNYVIPGRTLASEYSISSGVEVELEDGNLLHIKSNSSACSFMPRQNVDVWQFDGVTFPRVFKLGVYGAEILILVVSLLFAFLKISSLTRREQVLAAVYSASLFAVFIGLVVPLQTYLSDKASYDISIALFVAELMKLSLLLWVVSFVCVWCLEGVLGIVPAVCLFGFALYEYLLTGVLSIGEPMITGNLSYYSDKAVLCRNLIVVGLIFVLCVWLSWRGKSWMKWLILIVGVMSLCSLLDVKTNRSSVSINANDKSSLCTRLEVAQSIEFSDKRNVLLFIVDSLTTEVATHIFRDDENLRKSFNGFCLFDNNVGIHHRTTSSIAGLFSGKQFHAGEQSDGYYEFVNSLFTDASLLSLYQHDNWSTYFICPGYPLGVAYPCPKKPQKETAEKNSPLFSRFGDSQKYTLYELVRFRMSPFSFKPYVYKYTGAGMGGYATLESELGMYSFLRRASVSRSVDRVFMYIHTEGGHFPYDVDRHGMKCQTKDEGYEPYFEKSYYALSNLADMLEYLRSRGLYDCSDIFVLADHGTDERLALKDEYGALPLRGYPMLMAKPAGSNSAFQIDYDTPTSMLNLHGVLDRERERSLSMNDVKGLLKCDERHFVWLGDYRCSEWVVNANREAKLVSDRDIAVRRKR